MSLAAENAGLGPCDISIPDPWITHTNHTNNNSIQQQSNSQSSLSSSSSISLPLSSPAQQAGLGGGLQSLSISQPPSQTTLSHSSQSKIMNAVAPAVACPPAATKKIRRKTENKPQSQINKCNNEKRRRELENEYIEQLGEFLQVNKRDMTACKPDKAAILSEVVKTFRRLLEQSNSRDTSQSAKRCSKPDCSDNCTTHPVQQGEVSSTEPPTPEHSINGHSPEKSAYFEAVQHYISNIGWALLEINSEGVIECATENVVDVLDYSRNELQGQSIYSYLHTGDHSKLSPILDRNSFSLGWGQDDGQIFLQTSKRTIKTRIRWLLKTGDLNETIEEKQQRQDKYKDLLIISAPVKDEADESSSVLCLITLPEDEQQQSTSAKTAAVEASMPQSLEQLTIKLDTKGKILNIDTSALRPAFSALTKEVGRSISDLCHYQDRHRLHTHIQEVLQSESNGTQSLPYRLRLGTPDVYVHVKPISVLFRNTKPNESDFIMAVHTLLSEQEIQALESLSSSSSSNPALSLPSTSHSVSHLQHSTSSMGGPLMTSVMNGNLSHQAPPVSPSSRSNHQSSTNNSNSSSANNNNNSSSNNNMNALLACTQASENSNIYNNSDFDFEFPHSTFEMDPSISWDSRPDSRASVTPVSTPRPPSVSAYSPAAAPMCPSPLTPYHGGGSAGQPSPSNNNNNNSTNNNNISLNSNNNTLNNHSGYGGNFAFQSIDDKEKVQEQIQQHQQQQQLAQQQQQHQQQQQQPQPHDSERLRNLLTTKRSLLANNLMGMEGGESEHTRNTNRILKGLLNSEDEKDGIVGGPGTPNSHNNKLNTASITPRPPQQNPTRPRSTNISGESKSSGGNNMLLQLLNDKSDDDDPDTRTNRAQSELLRQLQKASKDQKEPNNNPINNEELMTLLRFQGNDLPPNRKRSANDGADDGSAAKRPDDKPSKLREKNRMLAKLLSCPSKAPSQLAGNLPMNRIVPAITTNIGQSLTQQQQQQQQQPNRMNVTSTTLQHHLNNNNNNNNSINNNNTLKQVQQQLQQQIRSQQQQQQQQLRKPSDIYLNQMQQPNSQQDANKNSHNHQNMMHPPPNGGNNGGMTPRSLSQQTNYTLDSLPFATSPAAASTIVPTSSNLQNNHHLQQQQPNEWDPELNEILNDVIDIVPDGNYSESDLNSILSMNSIESTTTSTSNITQLPSANQSQHQDIQEKLAISAIQKSLMQIESNNIYGNSPPAYPVHGMNNQQQHQPQTPPTGAQHPGFPPPPVYSQRPIRMPQMNQNNNGGNGGQQQQQQTQAQQAAALQRLQYQQHRDRLLQQQQKERLLQQQQKQQMVVPSNATAPDQLCLTPGMQNIESLLNNTVAPNVSLQRSTNIVTDSQLSPGFPQGLISQLSPNQRGAPFSPQSGQGYQQSPYNTNTGQRLSPQQQQMVGGANFQPSPSSNSNPQLSPRQPPFSQVPSQSQQSPASAQQWNNASNARHGMQAQQNPMMNAQLSGVNNYNSAAAARQFSTAQRQRSLNSPGAVVARQNSFPGQDNFPGSPNPSQASYGNAVFNSQQMRMQRQQSVPQGAQHLPGSPRPYGHGTDTTGYGMMYNNMQHASGTPNDFYGRAQTVTGSANNNGMNQSEYVRQELRAVVSGRTQSGGSIRTSQSPLGIGQGPMVGGNVVNNNNNNNNSIANNNNNPNSNSSMNVMSGSGGSVIGGSGGGSGGQTPQSQQMPPGTPILNTPPDLDPNLRFNFDMPQADFFGGATNR